MIFADIVYTEHYDDMHQELVDFIEQRFPNVESGHQGDSWIWITTENDKIQIDTFSAMHHQVKSPYPESKLVHDVIQALQTKYTLTVYSEPQLEAHED